jgi:hypothetical protein
MLDLLNMLACSALSCPSSIAPFYAVETARIIHCRIKARKSICMAKANRNSFILAGSLDDKYFT